MAGYEDNSSYKIWAVDNVVYGPVDLPILSLWTKEERVTADTWIYDEQKAVWQKAGQMRELESFFGLQAIPNENLQPISTSSSNTTTLDLKPGALRRIKVFGNFDDAQLTRLREYLVFQPVRQWSVVVKQGDPGDAMYMIIEGEVRVRIMIGEKETIITTLTVGEFFGEFCLFDHGPRSADVVANIDTQVLKMTASSFHDLLAGAPDLAAPFLTSICKTLAARIRADNKRYRDSISFARARQ